MFGKILKSEGFDSFKPFKNGELSGGQHELKLNPTDTEGQISIVSSEKYSFSKSDILTKLNLVGFDESILEYKCLEGDFKATSFCFLNQANDIAVKEGFLLGFKLVRGAYMEKERERAHTNGYKSPICVSKSATDDNFDACLEYILNHLKTVSVFIGTHNEKSTMYAVNFMIKRGISKNDPRIWFGQLYGMSDHISFNLANAKYNVAKYLPFGPIKDVMPYLIRRAEENTSVAGQTTRELSLIKTEKKRRKI